MALLASLVVHASLLIAGVTLGTFVPAGASPRPRSAALLSPPSQFPPEEAFGRRGGMGEALADFTADVPLESPHAAQDQPLLGLFARGPLRQAEPSPAAVLSRAQRSPALPPAPSIDQLVAALRTDAGEPLPPAGAPPAAAPAEAPESQHVAEAEGPTDPGPAAGREVDLFTKEAFADYRAGAAVARDGREHKIRGLRSGLTAFLDAAFLPRPVIVRFRLKVDDEGTPLRIDIVQGSGSEALDRTIRTALFNSWFDPDPSRTGRDRGKPFHFTIRIH